MVLGRLKLTKTERRRTVEIVLGLRDDLRLFLPRKAQPAEIACPNENGGYLDLHNWRRRVFYPACTRAGVKVTPNELRHTFCSLLAHEGRSAVYIAAAMGHSLIETQSRYSHIIDDARLSPMKPMADAIYEARAELAEAAASSVCLTHADRVATVTGIDLIRLFKPFQEVGTAGFEPATVAEARDRVQTMVVAYDTYFKSRWVGRVEEVVWPSCLAVWTLLCVDIEGSTRLVQRLGGAYTDPADVTSSRSWTVSAEIESATSSRSPRRTTSEWRRASPRKPRATIGGLVGRGTTGAAAGGSSTNATTCAPVGVSNGLQTVVDCEGTFSQQRRVLTGAHHRGRSPIPDEANGRRHLRGASGTSRSRCVLRVPHRRANRASTVIGIDVDGVVMP